MVSEGYRTTEMGQFAADVQAFVNILFATPPINEFASAINVYRVDVTSHDSGADDPATCGGTGATPATYFDASFCGDGVIQRSLTVNKNSVRNVVNGLVLQWHQILVIVNSPIHGGTGGSISISSKSTLWLNTCLHELGHSAFHLGDEYEYLKGCSSGETDHNNHPAHEPAVPNVTTHLSPIKWSDLIRPGTPVPTTTNTDCTRCDPQPSPVPVGTVGAFEGADYYHCGAYRPEFNCKMRMLDQPYCATCQREIRRTLAPYIS